MTERHIILGVTGGIAVYKAADLCSKLVSAGFQVRVVMTPSAVKLISPKIFLMVWFGAPDRRGERGRAR